MNKPSDNGSSGSGSSRTSEGSSASGDGALNKPDDNNIVQTVKLPPLIDIVNGKNLKINIPQIKSANLPAVIINPFKPITKPSPAIESRNLPAVIINPFKPITKPSPSVESRNINLFKNIRNTIQLKSKAIVEYKKEFIKQQRIENQKTMLEERKKLLKNKVKIKPTENEVELSNTMQPNPKAEEIYNNFNKNLDSRISVKISDKKSSELKETAKGYKKEFIKQQRIENQKTAVSKRKECIKSKSKILKESNTLYNDEWYEEAVQGIQIPTKKTKKKPNRIKIFIKYLKHFFKISKTEFTGSVEDAIKKEQSKKI